jgi:intergrase/recombinase
LWPDARTSFWLRFTARSDEQAATVKAALQEANAATRESIEMIARAREDLGATAASNRAALEATSKAIAGVAQILDEFKTSSRDYVEVLRLLLEKTDGTMRTFTDVLVKSGVETATQTDWLREVLPAIEANAQTLVTAAERISRAIEDLRARRPSPKRETID